MEKKFNKVKLLNKSTTVKENKSNISFQNEREDFFIEKIINSPVFVEERGKESDISVKQENFIKHEEENIVLENKKEDSNLKDFKNNDIFHSSSGVEIKKETINSIGSKKGFVIKNKLFVFPILLLLLSSIILNAFLINHINKIDYPITEQQLYSFAEKGINGFSDPLLFKSQYLMNKEELQITDKEELKKFSIEFVKKLYSVNARNSNNIDPNKPLRWVEVIEDEISLEVQKGKILANIPFYQYDNEKKSSIRDITIPEKIRKDKITASISFLLIKKENKLNVYIEEVLTK